MAAPSPTPSTILILGTGVFGLTAAHALLTRPRFANTKLIVVSPEADALPAATHATTASLDSSRIIRADYADALYAQLAEEAHARWRTADCGAAGRYTECGLLLTSDASARAGAAYVAKSLANVRRQTPAAVRELPSPAAIAAAMRAPGAAVGSGDAGYLNAGSGWADAAACMAWLRARVVADGGARVAFVKGAATRLLHDAATGAVRGAALAGGEEIVADLTLLATGAWTPALLDTRGVASARAQTMAYYALSDDEAAALRDAPVHLNLGTGRFVFPPTRRADGSGAWEVKAARHAFGYTNPVQVAPAPLGVGLDEESVAVSLPAFPAQGIPAADAGALTAFVHEALPLLAAVPREPAWTRLCYYLDTLTGDFLVCFHPAHGQSLFVATGGSGHAFKFLPVLGEKVVDVLEEGLDGATAASKWAAKWAWPKSRGLEDEVWCDDGSRAGTKGVTLEEAMSIAPSVNGQNA